MKVVLANCLIGLGLIVFAACGYMAGSYRQSTEHQKGVEEELNGIYAAIADSNVTQMNVLDHHQRLLHYISGHNSAEFQKFCPECGLLEQIQIRKLELDNEIRELSEYIEAHLNETHPEKTDKIKVLTLELNSINKYIFRADEQSKKLSKVVKVQGNSR